MFVCGEGDVVLLVLERQVGADLCKRDIHPVPTIKVGEKGCQRRQCRRPGQGINPKQKRSDGALERIHKDSVCPKSTFVHNEVLQAVNFF